MDLGEIYEWLVKTDITLYSEASTMARTGQGDSSSFDVNVAARQGSIFSPLLFAIVIDIVTKTARGELPWELLYIDILVLTANTKEEL